MIHHSDRGAQYANADYLATLADHGLAALARDGERPTGFDRIDAEPLSDRRVAREGRIGFVGIGLEHTAVFAQQGREFAIAAGEPPVKDDIATGPAHSPQPDFSLSVRTTV